MWNDHLDRNVNIVEAEHEELGLALIESLRVLNAVINLNSLRVQSWRFLCLARPFCCIQDGET